MEDCRGSRGRGDGEIWGMRITSCGGRWARIEFEATESREWGQGYAECFSEALN